jgi:hypothetical protein
MSGDRRSVAPRLRTRRRLAVRFALAAIAAAVALTATPGVAAATTGTVTPVLDCISESSGGTYSAVLGYSNTTGRTVSIPLGSNNVIWPSKFNGRQPTTFKPGVQHGVFTVTFSINDLWYSAPSWTLNGQTLGGRYYYDVDAQACPPSTQMPGEGNDTGAAIGLLAAGVVGVLLIRRVVRRANTSPAAVGSAVGAARRAERGNA